MTRLEAPAALEATGVIAVLRGRGIDECRRVIDTLLEAGILAIELTLTTPGTLEALAAIVSNAPSDASIGVGTVMTTTQVESVVMAGGQFVVSPTLNRAVIEAATLGGIASFPGALTPSEVEANWAAGATAVKVFPASTVGPPFLAHIHGPFPGIHLMPSGGVAIQDIPSWIHAGAIAVSLGGPLIGDALVGGSLRRLQERSHLALEAVETARAR